MNVFEISKTAAGGYAGSLLAALTPPELDAPVVTRLVLDDVQFQSPGGECFLHHGKAELQPSSPRKATAEHIHLDPYRVLIEDVGPAELRSLGWTYTALKTAYPDLIIISLSAFGLSGAYSDWLGNDFLAQAVGGVMHATGYSGEAPVGLPGEAAFMIAGLHGATAALAATYGDGSGMHIDISAQDTYMQHWTRHVAEYAYSSVTTTRAPRNPEGLHYVHTARAKDGWLYLLALREPWQDLAAFLGLGELLPSDAFNDSADAESTQQPPWVELEQAFHDAVASKSKYQWFAEAADLGWTFAPVEDPFEIAASPQVAARGGMLRVPVQDSEGTSELLMPPLPWLDTSD